MHAVLYSFQVKKGKEKTFLDCWSKLTKLIYTHEGSLGSRLHKTADGLFIAYAVWPNEQHFDKAGSNLPASANEIRKEMKESCTSINTLYKMNIVKDLLI